MNQLAERSYLQHAVQRLEDRLLTMPQAAIETTHTFLPGKYERAIRIPPWTVLTGAEHRTAYRVRVEEGTIAVNTDDGIKMLSAPCEFEATAGVKRVGRVFGEPVTWVDVYDNPDDCRDLTILEERLYVVPECGLGENRRAQELDRVRADYHLFLEQLGISQASMDMVVSDEADLMPMPPGYDVEVRPSQVHGKGLFALRVFEAGDTICPGRLDGKRTPAGRFINHSPEPNVIPLLVGANIYAVAARGIQVNEELLTDYRVSMRVNFGIRFQGVPPCQAG